MAEYHMGDKPKQELMVGRRTTWPLKMGSSFRREGLVADFAFVNSFRVLQLGLRASDEVYE